MEGSLSALDIGILVLYCLVLVGLGLYYRTKCRTAQQFMVADRTIPAWAAGLAVMSAYTSSISYIATPGKAYDSNWHVFIFSLCIIPVAWLVCKYAIPYYRKRQLVSVYAFLEDRLGAWGRIYAALSFLLFMVGRMAVILYLVSLLINTFVPWHIGIIIVVIGAVTIVYTLLGGMEAVIWTDVMQSIVMIVGIVFCAVVLSRDVFAGPEPLIQTALDADKFSLGSRDLSLSSRTVLVMIIYGVTENLRNLLADQNYVQKYSAVPTERDAKRSVWFAMLIYIPLTAIFLYIGTALFAFYSGSAHQLGETVTKGDEVFPYFIATELPSGLRGLILAAIVAAAMSTVDSALNCSATVLLLDFVKRYFKPDIGERGSLLFLRLATVGWGVLGTASALLMIRARSALDVWWQISGIFGGGILGLFILGLLRVRLTLWQGLVSILASVAVITWGTFARDLPAGWGWAQCDFDKIIIGAVGTGVLMLVAFLFGLVNRWGTPAVGLATCADLPTYVTRSSPITVPEALFSFRGRMSRSDYWLKGFLPLLPVGIFNNLLAYGVENDAVRLVATIIGLVSVWPAAALVIKRMHDCNRSGWLVLASLIPFLGIVFAIWIVIEAWFARGTSGPNCFGNDPLSLGKT